MANIHEALSDFQGNIILQEILKLLHLLRVHIELLGNIRVDDEGVGDEEIEAGLCGLILCIDTDEFPEAGSDVERYKDGLLIGEGTGNLIEFRCLEIDKVATVLNASPLD